jgi:hypothetical protein
MGDYFTLFKRIKGSPNEEKTNPKAIIPPLYSRLVELQDQILKLIQAKFIFKNEKQIETNMDRSIVLEVSFFNGNCKSLLTKIHKLKLQIESELKVLTHADNMFTDTDIAKSVKI